MAVESFGTGLYLPLAMLYFLQVTRLDLGTIGILVSTGTALTLPIPVAVGWLVDRFGPQWVVASGQALQGIGFLCYLVVSGPGSLMAAVVVTTAGLRVYWSSVFTLVADHADADRPDAEQPAADRADAERPNAKDDWFARTTMVREAGVGGGALVAGALLGADSARVHHGLILGSAVLMLAAALVVGVVVPSVPHGSPPAQGRSGYRALLRDRPYLKLIGTCTIFALCSTFLSLSLPVYLVKGLSGPGWAPGPLLALNTLLLATCTGVVTRYARRRWSRPRTMAVAGGMWTLWCAASAAAVLFPPVAVVPFMAGVVACYSVAEMMYGPASNALTAAVAAPGSRGTYLAVFQYAFAAATMIAPSLFGLLFSRAVLLPWLAVGLLAALGAVLILRLERQLPAPAPATARSSDVTLPRP